MAHTPIIDAFLKKVEPTDQQLVLCQCNEPNVGGTVYYLYDNGTLSSELLVGQMQVEGKVWNIEYHLEEKFFRIYQK